ncbi:ubiquitin carboxyl-terminal hydrolase 8-like [Liolophura sinensis]|uniref:ubiquitin carboxyl-terminal hydrolase 8-like n=1 Tax=Liolophura sinensis TaxID=3198878 RepID=UPI003159460F
MPVSTAIDLYLAKSVGELNSKAEIPHKSVIPKVYIKTAEKLITDANRCCSLGDEEKAYVLYMRYFNIISLIKKSPDYKKQKDYYDSLIGRKNQLQAIEKAETLSKSLTNRYELREAEAVSKKLDEEREKAEKKRLEEEAKAKEEKAQEEEKEKQANGTDKSPSCDKAGTITAPCLYQLIQSSPDQLIIMDARSSNEFADSHLQHKSVINVPVDIITPGITVPRIETSLPVASRELWEKRAQMEYIILMDWDSTLDKIGPGKTLQTLKDALFKFDSKTIIKSEPLILEGGYDEWRLYYPAITTHPVKDRPLYTKPLSNIPSLDFDYPDLDAAFIQTPSPEAKAPNGQLPGSTINQSESLPNLPPQQKARPFIPDRTKKPTLNSQTSLEQLNNNISEKDKSFYSSSASATGKKAELSADSSNTLVMQPKPKSNIVAEQERELAALQILQSQKQDEMQQFQKEKERMALEHKARLEQLKTRQSELEKLERMKRQQEKDVADLMRMKRRLEEEVRMEKRKEEEERREKAAEEEKRTAELERMKLEEEARIERLKSVEESRSQRKLKEETERMREENLKKEEEAANIAEAEKLRLQTEALEGERRKEEEKQRAEEEKETARKNEELKLEQQRQENLKKTEQERKRREEIRLQQEREREELKRKEEERKKKLEEQRLAEEKEKQEQERLKQERLERERKEKERMDREKAEAAKRVAEERLKRIAEAERRPKPSPSTMLPVGWERRLDKNTNRYFYLNHNDGTSQWDPPQMTSATSSPAHGKVYKTKLRDEESGRSSGLHRSHSSPNIAQLVEDEGNKRMPNFNRGEKPTIRPLPSQSMSPSNRAISVRAARLRDLNPVYGNVGAGLTGLRNLGNTCYMNSTLQCLNNCYPLVSYFLNDNYLEDINRESKFSYNGEVVDEFAVVMKALWQKQYKYISAIDLVVCSHYNSLFEGTDHQDSQEFLAFLLDGLHEGLNRIKYRPKLPEIDTQNMPDLMAAEKSLASHKLHNESIIVELFQGMLKSRVTCLSCGKTSTRFDVFQYLSLPIPSSASQFTLQDCLREFLKEEKLSGSSMWDCPNCKVKREAVKKLDIWKLPHILIVHLKRFYFGNLWQEKRNNYVDFPVHSMDLDNIVAGPRKRKPYSLYAVANHYGTMEAGHYTAYAKNPLSGVWHKFDDQEVQKMSSDNVKTSAAYFLFYTCL